MIRSRDRWQFNAASRVNPAILADGYVRRGDRHRPSVRFSRRVGYDIRKNIKNASLWKEVTAGTFLVIIK